MEENGKNPTTSKTGPKPKKLKEKVVQGLAVGRNGVIVPPEEVVKLAALGCKDREIADWFGINEETLRYNFKDFLIKGRESLKHSLRRAMLHNACVNNNAAVQIFLAKNILGMSDSPLDSEANAPLPWSDD